MPNDVFYGEDCETRIGIMADANTDPTVWYNLEYIMATITPTRDRKPRPKLGRTLNNTLDPVKPVNGFERLAVELTVDACTRHFARILRLCLGAPTTTGSGPYTHVWKSGDKTQYYFALQIRTSASMVHVFRGLMFSALSADGQGDQVEDYNIKISLKGLSRARVNDWLSGTVTALPTAAPALRAVFLVNDVAASNVLSASLNYDRQLAEDLFLSATPTVSGIRPNGGEHSGQVQIRAIGDAFDDLEEQDTAFDAKFRLVGSVLGHSITLQHPLALFNAAPLSINGPGEIERSWSYTAYQDASNPAFKITIVNDVASLAT